MRIRTILCPIDFSNLSAREIQSAAEVGRAFGARLVLHHNRMAIAPGLARAWDWETTHRSERLGEAEAERRMAAALEAVPAGIAGRRRDQRRSRSGWWCRRWPSSSRPI